VRDIAPVRYPTRDCTPRGNGSGTLVNVHTVVGREAQLSRLGALIDGAATEGQVLLLLGEAGIGKSTLLANATERALAAGMRVLRADGRESAANIAFAGLHQLLSPALGAAADLEPRQARALRGALGLSGEPATPDLLGTGIATLTLLSDLAETAPVLAVIDDAHWLDRSSLDILAFVGSRLAADRVVLLLAARGQAPPAGFDRGFAELPVEALPAADAGLLLDRQPAPPRGQARAQVLAQADGNPMVLIELAKVVAGDPAASRRWAATPLPPGDRLMAVITSRLTTLPEPTRAALVMAAVADGPDLSTASGIPGPDPGTLAPAERLGLITMDRAGLRFTHPLVRSAIYHGAPFAQRAAAHRQLAAALPDQPDRQAWHLAAATIQPDEEVAARLETTAADARRRGGVAATALALERAAELSPDPRDQARRLISAASAAISAGQPDWVQDLATRAATVTADPELRLLARSNAGWALAYSGRRAAALAALISVAEEASADFPGLAWEALADAATVAYQSGAPADSQAVNRLLRLMENQAPQPAGDRGSDAQKTWIRTCTDPFGSRSDLVGCVRRMAGAPLDEAARWRIGSAAWLLDESDLGVRLLRDAMYRLRAPGTGGTSGGGLTALGWLYIDTGRWDDAFEAAAEAADLAEANRMDIVAASAAVIAANVFALRADIVAARTQADKALAAVDPADSGLIAARAWRALGVAALAEGSHLLAFTQLRRLFSEQGVPVHNIFSYLGVADMAAAAVRADRRHEGRSVLERALGHLEGRPSPRLQQLIARAQGILAGPAAAGAHFAAALGDPAGEQWPFERAQLRLDHAEWLRRRRRVNEAKPELARALETFRRLGARSLAERTEAELRASGIVITGAPGGPGPLLELTPQQHQIVRLARDGLTNREIGDRLSLSPRTVSSHLYRSFPKLGITDRHQLRDVITHEAPP
jgi:DNA-binding CsgD family transcriptional regulator/tetratricopeptide (TPR) repeat protein